MIIRCQRLSAVALLFVLAVSGCGSSGGGYESTSANPFQGVSESQIEISGPGHDQQDETASACADFELDSRQVARFLRGARVVSDAELHDRYDIYPCWVDATVDSEGSAWSLRVRIGGVALAKSGDRALSLVGRLPG